MVWEFYECQPEDKMKQATAGQKKAEMKKKAEAKGEQKKAATKRKAPAKNDAKKKKAMIS